MESFVIIYVHHHDDLVHAPKVEYKGGKVDVIPAFDTDIFSFRDLDDFAKDFEYDPSDLVYFQTGMCIDDGVKLLYDDSTIREMVDIHKPLGMIDLYVDHYSCDEVINSPYEENLNESEGVEVGQKDDKMGGNVEYGGSDDDEFSDPDYNVGTESDSEESEKASDDDIFGDSDEEFAAYKENERRVLDDMNKGVNVEKEYIPSSGV